MFVIHWFDYKQICHKMLTEWEKLLSVNSLTSVYSNCSDIPIPIFSELLYILPRIARPVTVAW